MKNIILFGIVLTILTIQLAQIETQKVDATELEKAATLINNELNDRVYKILEKSFETMKTNSKNIKKYCQYFNILMSVKSLDDPVKALLCGILNDPNFKPKTRWGRDSNVRRGYIRK
jgi:uncharacterized membrane protein YvbJ